MSNKRGFKVKRSKSRLYKKRRSKASKAAQTIAFIIAIIVGIALLIVIYSAIKPLAEYLTSGNKNSSVSYWAPTVEATTEETEQTTAATMTAAPETTAPPLMSADGNARILAGDDLLTVQSVQMAIGKAKADGCTEIVCVLKDETGFLWYKTENKDVKDSEIVNGSVSASQLYSMISNAGLTPVAKISTLKDHKAQPYVDGSTYRFGDGSSNWIDARPENGGKAWLSPFNKPSVDYIASLVGEITKSGFKTIILANTEYPDFRQYDFTVLADIGSASKRAEALFDVVSACEAAADKNGAALAFEISAAELIANEDFASTTAEILNIGSRLSNDIGIVLNYNDEELDGFETLKLPEPANARYTKVTRDALKKLGERTVTPYYSTKNPSDERLEALKMISKQSGLAGIITE